MYVGFGPGERVGDFIVGLDEGVDMGTQLGDGGKGGAVQGMPFQDREPDHRRQVAAGAVAANRQSGTVDRSSVGAVGNPLNDRRCVHRNLVIRH